MVRRLVERLVARRVSPLDLVLFGVGPLACLGLLTWFATGNGGGGDFAIFRGAGRAVSEGHTPYVAPTLRLLAQNNSYVYPAPFAYPFVPFAWLPEHVAAVIFLLLSAAAVVISVYLLGARDWRVYAAAFLTVPMFGALAVGAIGPLLLLLVAGGWRYRDRPIGGVLLALAAAAKLFLWPLLVWLVLTRRLRASVAAAATLAAIIGVWALTDLHGLTEYPTTIRLLNEVHRTGSYSPQALALALAATPTGAAAVSVVAALVGIGLIFLLRRRDRDAFIAAIGVALFATPILWMHYLVLLIVPLVLFSPSLTPLWLVLLPLWVTPTPDSAGAPWRIILALTVAAVVCSVPRFPSRHRSEQPERSALA